MLPFPSTPGMEMMIYGAPIPNARRGGRIRPHPAGQMMAAGRMMGYQEAMRKMQGAAAFIDREREARPFQAPPRELERPVRRMKLEDEATRTDRYGTPISSGNAIPEDVYKQYRYHKKKQGELSHLVAAGPERHRNKKRPSRETEWIEDRLTSGDTRTISTSSSSDPHRHYGRHQHRRHHIPDTEDLRLMRGRTERGRSPDSMWAQHGTPYGSFMPSPSYASQYVQMPPQHAFAHGSGEHFDRNAFDAYQRQKTFGGGTRYDQVMPGFGEHVRRGARRDAREAYEGRAGAAA
ncbi:hypothetical protein LTR85_011107 [Meristemomyces frigidus]|nr:hypothetical protein LTR85_011107 [Meristemomyces frigidus]